MYFRNAYCRRQMRHDIQRLGLDFRKSTLLEENNKPSFNNIVRLSVDNKGK